jgi:two-component system, OmpR family, sensor histidine kinase KdpD
MLYLVVISVVAVLFGRGPSLLASALSVAAYDIFVVPPFFTFVVSDQRHVLTFATMFAVSLFISGLMLRIRRQEQGARDREARTSALYALSRDLAAALDEVQAAGVLAKHTADVFQGAVAVIFEREHRPTVVASAGGDLPFDAAEQGVAQWVLDFGRPAGRGTDTLPGTRLACFPIHSGGLVLGVLALAPRPDRFMDVEARHSLEAFVRQGGLAIERARLADLAKAAALRARTEEMRSSLLSAVSHDLRTPLAAIMGAATALRDRPARVPVTEQDDLLEAICEEAERLERLVRNLLDMTRVESGDLTVKREWVPLEEIIGSALGRLEKRLGERAVRVELAADLPLASVDPVLFEQVFINLFENAVKYTPAGSQIEVVASAREHAIDVEVRDRGPGLPAQGQRVFEKFFRGPHRGVSGVGLGLPICKGIVEAHGGTILAENREAGGAVFRVSIPIVGAAPSIPSEMPEETGRAEART